MTTTGARVQIRGLDELRRKLGDDLIAQPARNFLNRAGTTVQSAARKNAPVDTGLLRNSITTEIDSSHFPMWVRIGPNTNYARYVEEGTRPHFVPAKYIGAWKQRHGGDGSTGMYVSGRAQPYLMPGLESSIPKIITLVPVMAREIEARAGQQ